MIAPGTVIAGYRIEQVLGQGGMGVVYEATQLSLNRTIALKFLSAHYVQDTDFRERFRREGVIQAAIDHPHIVPVYEAGEVPEGLFLAMRLVRGPNLKELIVDGVLDPDRAIAILTQVADALAAAHAAGLTHRDIKPQNILVGTGDHGFLADFGLTKDSDVSGITRTGQFLGTLDYVAPEQINGESASARSDIYALTAVLYECLTGSVPYPRPSEAAVLFAHVTDPPPRVSERRPDLPAELDDVIARGMAKLGTERPDSARELLDDAARALGHDGSSVAARAVEPPVRRAPTTLPKPEPAAPAAVSTEVDVAAASAGHDVVAASTEHDVVAASTELDLPPATTEQDVVAASTEVDVEAASTEQDDGTASTELEVPPATTEDDETAATVPLVEPDRQPTAPTVPDLRTPPAAVPSRPAKPAKPAKPTDGRTGRRLALAALVVAVVGGGLAGALAGASGAPEEPPPPGEPQTVAANGVAVTAPAGWRRAEADARAVPGMVFENPIAVTPSSGPSGRELIAGSVASGHPSLLANGLRKRLDGAPPRDDAVELGEVAAYRYAGLTPTGLDRSLELLTVPSTQGVITVACLAPPAQVDSFIPACEDVARTLRLDGPRAYALGPDAAFAGRLSAAMKDLSRRRASLRADLGAAERPRAQAQQAKDLAEAFSHAGDAVARGAVSPAAADARAAIVDALRGAARRYRALARTASQQRRRAYRRERTAVAEAESRVERALDALRAEGYEVG